MTAMSRPAHGIQAGAALPLVDHRIYTIRLRKMPTFLDVFERLALPILRETLGHPLGFYVSQVGLLNQFVHLWRYDSMADREQRRNAMYADPLWLAYRQRTGEAGLVLKQENRLLRSVDIALP